MTVSPDRIRDLAAAHDEVELAEMLLRLQEAARELDDLIPTLRAFVEDEDFHVAALRLHSALAEVER